MMSQSDSTRSLRSSASVGVLVKPPLDGRSVEHASQSCGALFRWVNGLVTEFVQRKRNLSELESANSDLHVAQERLSCAEEAATELDSKLAKYRRALADKEIALERLQRQAEQKKMLGQVLLREIERDVVSMQIKRNGKLDAYGNDFVGRVWHLPREGLLQAADPRLFELHGLAKSEQLLPAIGMPLPLGRGIVRVEAFSFNFTHDDVQVQ